MASPTEMLKRMKLIVNDMLLIWTSNLNSVVYTSLNDMMYVLECSPIPKSKREYDWCLLSTVEGLKKLTSQESWKYIKPRRNSSPEDIEKIKEMAVEFKNLLEELTKITNNAVLKYINDDEYVLLE